MRRVLLLTLLALSCGRTEIRPELKPTAPARAQRESSGECIVHDYQTSTDIPSGATNLGWVAVPREGSDEATFLRLRKAVCAKGGTAFSQARWNRPAGASLADAPAELEANAWVEQ
jgi:hypothetical protein